MVHFILIIKIFNFSLFGIILKVNGNTMMSRERGLQKKRKSFIFECFQWHFFPALEQGAPHFLSELCPTDHVVMALLSKLVSLTSEIH